MRRRLQAWNKHKAAWLAAVRVRFLE